MAGWIAAQCGVYVAPSTDVAFSRSLRGGRVEQVQLQPVLPRLRGLGAGAGELGLGAGQDDRAAHREVGVDALGRAHPGDLGDRTLHRAVLRDRRVAPNLGGEGRDATGYSAEHQPPLRPDAPKPAISASSTATRSDGSAASR